VSKNAEAKKIKSAISETEKVLAKAKKKFEDAAKKVSLELWPKLTDLPKVGAVAQGGKISPEQKAKMREPAKRRSKARKSALASPDLRKARKDLKRAQRKTKRLTKLLAVRTAKKAEAPAAEAAPAS